MGGTSMGEQYQFVDRLRVVRPSRRSQTEMMLFLIPGAQGVGAGVVTERAVFGMLVGDAHAGQAASEGAERWAG